MGARRLLGGRYEVGELLGYGGMAEVHGGRDLRLGRDVAIKMLRTDLARDATFQLRFRREAQNAASLNHPAIVAVYDTGEESGPTGEIIPYIVMEFVNGRTLKEVLTAEGRLMPRRALEITADVAAALEFSHRHGIIHRDIKPGNVMLTQTGQVKVMDFGIARAMASGATTMTQTSAVIGTAQYLSPEQARGEVVDARSDVYATGCVLYELLTGRPPFVGDNPVSVAYQHVREDAQPPSRINRDIPPAVDAIVLKALAKNRMNRYQSAAEMRADVLRAASGRPVLATPVMTDDAGATMPVSPARLAGSRSTGTMARVGNPRRRRASNWALITLTLLGLLAVASLAAGLYIATRPNTAAVPQLAGLSPNQAEQALHRIGLNGSAQQVAGSDCTVGQVFGPTSPAVGTQARKGSTVSYQVCAGPGQATIPNNLIRMDKAAALQALNALHLQVDFLTTDSTLAKDLVANSDPVPGTTVPVGTVVKVYLSLADMALVPDVRGKAAVDATDALHKAGFVDVKIKNDNNITPAQVGLVTNMVPSPSTTTPHLFTETIVIYVGALESSPSPSPSS